jgi:hypothetical protein
VDAIDYYATEIGKLSEEVSLDFFYFPFFKILSFSALFL